MNARNSDLNSRELAMHVLLMVQRRASRQLLVSDFAEMIKSEFGLSRPTAFRYARTALDVLCVPPLPETVARLRRGDRSAAGIEAAREMRA